MDRRLCRRDFLRVTCGALGTTLLAACAPQVVRETVVVEKEVEKIVKETVIVEGEAKVVEKVVEKEVTRVVEKEQPKPSGKVTEVSFMNQWFTTPPLDIYTPTIAAFEEANPDIKIEHIKTQAVLENVMTLIAGGTAPDIIQWNFGKGEIAELASRAALLPIDSLLATSELNMDDFWQVQWDHKEWGGNIWGTPIGEGAVSGAFGWHKRYFDEAGYEQKGPSDWETAVDYAIKLTKYDDAGNIAVQGWDPMDCGHWKPTSWAMYMDSPFISDDKRTMMFDQGNWPVLLKIFADVYQTIGVEQMVAFNDIWPPFTSDVKAGFPNGTRAMVMNGSWQPGELKKSMKDQSWEIGYDWVPTVSGKKYTSFGKSHSLVLPRTCKIPETAFRFMEYCAGMEANLIMWDVRGAAVWSKPLSKVVDLSPYPGLDFFFSMLDDADKVFGPKELYCPIQGEMQAKFKRAAEAAIFGEKTPEEAAADVNVELQQALDFYWEAEDRKK